MRVQEHLIEVLLIVKRVLSFKQLIELEDRLIERFDVLVLDSHPELIG